MYCTEHKQKKTKRCGGCNTCTHCDPSPACTTPQDHKAWAKRNKYKRLRLPEVCAGTRNLRYRGSTHSTMDSDEDSIFDLVQCNKEVLQQVCKLLNVDTVILNKLPKYGFTKAHMQTECNVQVANLITNKLIEEILYKISPLNEDFYTNWKKSVNCTSVQSHVGVDSNLASLFFCGNRNTRIIAESVLCSSYNNVKCKEILYKEYAKYDNISNITEKQKETHCFG